MVESSQESKNAGNYVLQLVQKGDHEMTTSRKVAQTESIIRRIREKTGTAIMFHSANGKDSIALLDMLAKEFGRVICIFMFFVDGLRHIEAYIKWATTHYPNVSFVKIQHPSVALYRKMGLFMESANQDEETVKLGELEQAMMRYFGTQYIFSGMKGVDGFMKRMRLKMWAPWYISPKGMVYPLALWTNKEVLNYIHRNGLIQPTVYEDGKVSQGIGVDYHTLTYLKSNFPDDYERILHEFPHAEVAIYDYERKQNKTEHKATGRAE